MRVNCNFLPLEYRSFILEKKVLALSILLYVGSMGLFIWTFMQNRVEVGKLTKKLSEHELERGRVQEQLNQLQYPQERIQRLIDQFTFIKKAMGATDFPWLRFYQSLEDAVPLGEGGRRAAHVVRLDRNGEKGWTLEGESEDWKDAVKFEENLIASTYKDKKNYADVRLIKYRAIEGQRGYKFTIQYTFNDNP